MRTTSGSGLRRPRSVWAALITAVVVCGLLLLGVLLPVLGLIGAADATVAGALDVPVGGVALTIVIGYGLSLVFLVLTFLSRRGAPAWVFAILAILTNLFGSVWPLVVTAMASVGQAQDIGPFIADLIRRATGG